MDLQGFLMEDVLPPREETLILSERFGGPFKVAGVSEEENAALRAACRRRSENGVAFDRERYLKKLAAAAVREPDLKDAALQQSWGVLGEEALLSKMLTAGEFAKLLVAVERVCGFGAPDGRKNALKKVSAGETAS